MNVAIAPILILLYIVFGSSVASLDECKYEADTCQDNPLKYEINISEDFWKAEFKPNFGLHEEFNNNDGFDSFPDYTTPSWITTPTVHPDCFFRDESNTSYICQSSQIVDLTKIFIPDTLKYFKINNTGISTIPNNVFANHTIGVLVINDNFALRKVSKNSFRGVSGLNYLYMHRNQNIRWRDHGDSFFYLFQEAHELRHLVLESNNISFKGKYFCGFMLYLSRALRSTLHLCQV